MKGCRQRGEIAGEEKCLSAATIIVDCAGRAARFAGSLLWLLWARAARRPVDSFAIFAAVAASLIIIVNAVVLQSGSRPAPFLVNAPPSPSAAGCSLTRSLAAPPPLRSARNAPSRRKPLPRRATIRSPNSSGMSSRIMTVQRVLSDYGYGQIKPTGVLDRPTSEAIEKFEREHNLPVTRRISDRLMSELAVMIGPSAVTDALNLRLAP